MTAVGSYVSELFRYLDTDGNGDGTSNAVGNYAAAAQDFKLTNFDDANWIDLHRMIVSIEDSSGFRAERYASLGAALTNGISVINANGGVENDLTDGEPIKTNAHWGKLCYDVELKSWGAGNELLLVRWTFDKSGQPFQLAPGDEFIVRLNDDFTGVIGHYFMVQGTIYRNHYGSR